MDEKDTDAGTAPQEATAVEIEVGSTFEAGEKTWKVEQIDTRDGSALIGCSDENDYLNGDRTSVAFLNAIATGAVTYAAPAPEAVAAAEPETEAAPDEDTAGATS